MTSRVPLSGLHPPKHWPRRIKSAVLHAISLAHFAIVQARGWAANSVNARVRQAAEIDQLRAEVAMLREEIRIKDARMAAILPHRRPHYPPVLRLAILELKAARAWSLTQTAKTFLVEPATIAKWLSRLDEAGPEALVQMPSPVNRFPDCVRHVVCRLKTLCPTMGKVKLAQTLTRAGLHLGTATVGRMLKVKSFKPKSPENGGQSSDSKPTRVVTAKRPNHVWHVDLTAVPVGGFWATWLPFALPQCWPFCWWAACVVDHFSRRVMGVAVFRKQPDSRQVQTFLARTIRDAKAKPKYIVCDKGAQFWCKPFKRWCRRRKIAPRFGAVGKHGSIAVIERLIRTFKVEGLRRVILPLREKDLCREISLYVEWFNVHRPHTALGGRTPDERYRRIPAACRRPRLEPRPCWPRDALCAEPQAKVRGQCGAKLELIVEFFADRKHLPIVTLKRAA